MSTCLGITSSFSGTHESSAGSRLNLASSLGAKEMEDRSPCLWISSYFSHFFPFKGECYSLQTLQSNLSSPFICLLLLLPCLLGAEQLMHKAAAFQHVLGSPISFFVLKKYLHTSTLPLEENVYCLFNGTLSLNDEENGFKTAGPDRMLGWKFFRNRSFLLRLTFSSSLILSSVKLLTVLPLSCLTQ